jgi:hypothetical protein
MERVNSPDARHSDACATPLAVHARPTFSAASSTRKDAARRRTLQTRADFAQMHRHNLAARARAAIRLVPRYNPGDDAAARAGGPRRDDGGMPRVRGGLGVGVFLYG